MTTCWLWGQISCYPSVTYNREAWLSPLAYCLCKSDHILSSALWYFYVNILEVTLSVWNQSKSCKNLSFYIRNRKWTTCSKSTLLSSNPRPLKTDDHDSQSHIPVTFMFSQLKSNSPLLVEPKGWSNYCLHRVVWHSTTAQFSLVWSQEPITWSAEANESSPSQYTVFVLSIIIILPYSSRYPLQWYFIFNVWRVILNSVYIFCLHIYTTICTAHLITSSILSCNSFMVNNLNNNNSMYPTNIYYPLV